MAPWHKTLSFKVDDHAAISSLLERYREFEECLLETLQLANFGTALELKFRYIWDDEFPGEARLAADPRLVTIALEGLREARIFGALPQGLIERPQMADWGLTEVAVVRLLPDSDELRKYQGTGRVHHMTILWESDRRIDAIFGDLQVNESG